MPFRKNLGFNEEASGVSERRPSAATCREYTVEGPRDPLTEVMPSIIPTDGRTDRMAKAGKVKETM
jgi:hypothetical protein